MKILALLFSLMIPGAGHIFAGLYKEGIVLGVLFVLGRSALLPLCVRALNVQKERALLQLFYASNCFYILLICYAVFSAVLQTSAQAKAHFLYAFFSVICFSMAYKKAFSKFIFTALCGKQSVYEFYLKNKKLPTVKK